MPRDTETGEPLVDYFSDDLPRSDGTDVAAVKKRVFLKCCLINIFVVVGIAVVGVIVLVTQIHPMCQSVINSATIVLANATMYAPTADTISLNASLSLNNAGPYNAYMQPFDCDLFNEDGVHFAKMTMPGLSVTANSPSPVQVSNRVTIVNFTVFTAAAAALLQGIPGTWYIKGTTTVQPTIMGFNITLNDVNIDTSLPLPATLLRGVEAYDTQILSGEGDNLVCTATTSFFSSSVLSISHLGETTFKLYTSNPDGSVAALSVGTATMKDFNVQKGVNTLKGAIINITKTPENYAHVSQLIGTWARNEDQTLYLKGPTASGILDGVVVQELLMKGVGQNLITASMIEGFYSLTGHNANTGEPCSLLSNKDCLRSALMILKNPGPFPLQLKNAGFNVDWTTPSKYKVSLKLVDVISESYDCPMVPEKLAYMYTTAGMYTYQDKALKNVDYITLPGNTSTSSVIVGTYQSGQNVPDNGKGTTDVCGKVIPGYSCCFATKFAAAACHSLQRGLNYIPATTEGNATVVAGTFELNVSMYQADLPIFFAETITNMSVEGVSTSCKHITFYE